MKTIFYQHGENYMPDTYGTLEERMEQLKRKNGDKTCGSVYALMEYRVLNEFLKISRRDTDIIFERLNSVEPMERIKMVYDLAKQEGLKPNEVSDWNKEYKFVKFRTKMEVVNIDGRSFKAVSKDGYFTIFTRDLMDMLIKGCFNGNTLSGTFIVVKRGGKLGVRLNKVTSRKNINLEYSKEVIPSVLKNLLKCKLCQ